MRARVSSAPARARCRDIDTLRRHGPEERRRLLLPARRRAIRRRSPVRQSAAAMVLETAGSP